MNKEEFRSIFKEFDRFLLIPKPGLTEVKIGGSTLRRIEPSYRAITEKNTIFVFAKGRSRRGYRAYDDEQILEQFDIVYSTDNDKDKKWHKDINRAIKALSSSGLWPNILQFLIDLSMMSYQDRNDIRKIRNEDEELTKMRIHIDEYAPIVYNARFEKAYKEYIEKYPFMFDYDDKGYYYMDTDYIYEQSDVKLKSMYFGKYYNQKYKDEIKNALNDKQDISRRAYASYDVSFQYRPDEQKAWYSEEYRGCGNGHYYIALDHNLALFIEND